MSNGSGRQSWLIPDPCSHEDRAWRTLASALVSLKYGTPVHSTSSNEDQLAWKPKVVLAESPKRFVGLEKQARDPGAVEAVI
jgi:hypothetical protein